MQRAKTTNGTGSESSLELKYCERCGSLWLRPAGGAQIYCRDCARAMAELPRRTNQPDRDEIPSETLWDEDDGDGEGLMLNIIDLDSDSDSDLDTKEQRHEWIH